MKRFKVTFEVEVELEVDDDVVADALSPEFRESYYKFSGEAEVVEHLAYNFARNHVVSLDELDGFAQWPSNKTKKIKENWDPIDFERVEGTK